MAQLLTPVDVEQAIIDELSGLYTVGTSIPETKPNIFLRVLAAGGAELNLVQDEPLVTIEAFSLRESTARGALDSALARLQLAVKQNGRIGDAVVSRIRFVGLPQNYPLPSVPTHKRYITTIAPAVRRAVVNL
ncbi:tail terminator [Microbacterium phage Celaena]|uniref:tail terminator n=1 Tax=Microbacterium phage Celaena TaxID=2591214 RepID=UPI001161D4D1|nr:tail terminator [Microbacterium phage Celaena]YP_010752337.1 tail terminator [Microbacterium phage Katzastrophic]QDH92390.1 tail terminator [Microbacterium phage Celaena]UKH48448.1 tail terminator [Microbacterium phage Katzastrophic]WNO28726.1 tail terminator [Microbacterium phage FlameThrower]